MDSDGGNATDPAVQAVDRIRIATIRRLEALAIVHEYSGEPRRVPSCGRAGPRSSAHFITGSARAFTNKIKVIEGFAHGFRSLERYRLQVPLACGCRHDRETRDTAIRVKPG
jgi:hypothetical protein